MYPNNDYYKQQADDLRNAISLVESHAPAQDLESARSRLRQLEEQAQYVQLTPPGQNLLRALEDCLGTEAATRAAQAVEELFRRNDENNRATVEWVKNAFANFHPELQDPGMSIVGPDWIENPNQ